MKIIGIEHVGIATNDLSKAKKFWNQVLGIRNTSTEDIDNQGVITDIYDTGNGKIELILSKYPKSAIAKFINKRGMGVHHVCLSVENIEDIGNNYTIGAEGFKVVFIHPRSTGGVLLELSERDL